MAKNNILIIKKDVFREQARLNTRFIIPIVSADTPNEPSKRTSLDHLKGI